MKKVIWQFLFFSLVIPAFSQKPSKEQMEKDRKAYAEAQKKLNERLSKMSPEARRMYDSMTGSVGMGQKIKDADSKINNNPATVKNEIVSNGILPVKKLKASCLLPPHLPQLIRAHLLAQLEIVLFQLYCPLPKVKIVSNL